MKKRNRELLEWVFLIIIVGVIYLGGWHTQVIGGLQQLILSTGIITPHTVEEVKHASYQFDLKDQKGSVLPMSSLKGEVVFVNFWATWCPPCIAEMPDINDLYNSTSDSITFLMISLDKDPTKAIEFVEKKAFDFPIYFLHSGLPKVYDVSSIPTTYVISKEGNIVVENHGMAKYHSKKFRSFLAELLEAQ